MAKNNNAAGGSAQAQDATDKAQGSAAPQGVITIGFSGGLVGQLAAGPKAFSTGSVGYYVNGKLMRTADGVGIPATPVTVKFSGNAILESELVGAPREFSTGSKGWYVSGKLLMTSGSKIQVGMNLILVGSKDGTGDGSKVQVGGNLAIIGSKK